MSIEEIMSMIDDEKISKLGEMYKVDKINTKITGKFLLKSFVYGALQGIPMSLRSIESMIKNNKDIADTLKSKDAHKKTVDHSSLGKRLSVANVNYFRMVYEDIAATYHAQYAAQKGFHIFDSTIISISSKLLKNGLNLGGKETSYVKMSIGLKNSIPSSMRFCTVQSEGSEDRALLAAINEAKIAKEEVILFDRGIQKTETFVDLDQKEHCFITRLNVGRKYKTLSKNTITSDHDHDLTVSSDENVHLFNGRGLEVKYAVRLIKATKIDGEELWFLTNVKDLSSYDIARAYKNRWSIEVLFKFLKQHLQFKTFISYNINGMQIYLYCLLIAAILFTRYKTAHNLTGYKIALLQFKFVLYKSIIKDIVLFCGGNPSLVDQRL
jgi:transposase